MGGHGLLFPFSSGRSTHHVAARQGGHNSRVMSSGYIIGGVLPKGERCGRLFSISTVRWPIPAAI